MFQQTLDPDTLDEARANLYVKNDASFQLSNVIQNVHYTENGQYLHEPTWLCT